MLNLLDHPLLRMSGRATPATLPEVLAALVRDDVDGWPGCRAHQEHAWHAFLVQLAAVALGPEGGAEAPSDPAAWRALLLGLTDGSGDPWSLVVDDLSRPAFLQPPVPEGTLAKFRVEETPDGIDLLVTAKNHDLKAARAVDAPPEAWIYALVSLQTSEGFSGRGNYGVARMNSGFGNRACVAYAPSLRAGARFVHDLDRLRADETEYDTFGGTVALLWLRPWDGATSLAPRELAPWYVEVCRRIRLTGDPLRAHLAPTTAPRIASEFQKTGPVRDGWCPLEAGDAPRLLTIGPQGFGYSKVVDILFGGGLRRNAASQRTAEDRWLVLRALVRGQGKTEGYHRRDVPVPATLDERAEEYGRRATWMVESAAKLRLKVLRPALTIAQSAATSPDGVAAAKARPAGATEDVLHDAGRRFDAQVDAAFFPHLWAEPWGEEAWLHILDAAGSEALREGIPLLPVPSPRRRLARVTAESAYRALLRRNFPELPDAHPTRVDRPSDEGDRSGGLPAR